MLFNFFLDLSPFSGATDTPVLDFWWCLSRVSKAGWILSIACLITCAQWIPQIHLIYILAHVQSLVGLESGIERASSSQRVTRQTLYRLNYADSAAILNIIYSSGSRNWVRAKELAAFDTSSIIFISYFYSTALKVGGRMTSLSLAQLLIYIEFNEKPLTTLRIKFNASRVCQINIRSSN